MIQLIQKHIFIVKNIINTQFNPDSLLYRYNLNIYMLYSNNIIQYFHTLT